MPKIDPKDLGTIVNDLQPDPEQQELDKKIAQLELSRIIVKVSPVVFDRLLKQAEFYNLSIEEYCSNQLTESLKTLVGQPHITGPSQIGSTVQKKVMGPSLIPTVTRA
jgi:hypothetical protein